MGQRYIIFILKISLEFWLFVIGVILPFSDIFGQAQAKPNVQSTNEDLTKKLSNPVSSLISVPFENNTDLGIGKDKGASNILNIQPVIPFAINSKINLITR